VYVGLYLLPIEVCGVDPKTRGHVRRRVLLAPGRADRARAVVAGAYGERQRPERTAAEPTRRRSRRLGRRGYATTQHDELMSTIIRQTIVIQRRFHGPPESGHGGYTCGLLARDIQGAAQVSLRSPPPLERPLTLERDDGGRLLLRDGETIVADAETATLKLDRPPRVELADARAASPIFRSWV